MKKLLIGVMLKSKKFWYAVSAIAVPMIVKHLGVDEVTATNVFWACLTLVVGQGLADSARK